MKFSTLAAVIGTASAGLGHKAEMSVLQKQINQRMNAVRSPDSLMELANDNEFFATPQY